MGPFGALSPVRFLPCSDARDLRGISRTEQHADMPLIGAADTTPLLAETAAHDNREDQGPPAVYIQPIPVTAYLLVRHPGDALDGAVTSELG